MHRRRVIKEKIRLVFYFVTIKEILIHMSSWLSDNEL
jgi:hypothetical protein